MELFGKLEKEVADVSVAVDCAGLQISVELFRIDEGCFLVVQFCLVLARFLFFLKFSSAK